jgi:hypothetical protein
VYVFGAAAEEQQAEGKAAKYDSYALDKISIRVSPKVFGTRIRCLHDDYALDEALRNIVANQLTAGYGDSIPGEDDEDNDE